jgi:cytochrome c oxidase subunit 2
MTLAAVHAPSAPPKLTVEVTGHQWWWEVRYPDTDPERVFTTADEIRIPAGEPVEVRLIGADVIHSFWVPALMGKTDMIPGQVNRTWIEAEKPGTFRAQCAEYCGAQHARMALLVVSMPPEEFRAWRERQLAPAPEPATEAARTAEATFVARCGLCHTVRGTRAGGRLGPDLSHLMTRKTLAAATLPNTTGHLFGWIADPQTVKPGSRMPRIGLSGPELQAIGSFLATLD